MDRPLTAEPVALAEPLEFPPLAAGIVPGDRVAIAVDEDVPCVAEIVRGAVEVSAKQRASSANRLRS